MLLWIWLDLELGFDLNFWFDCFFLFPFSKWFDGMAVVFLIFFF